jgi:GT2 family glycosyltransferase
MISIVTPTFQRPSEVSGLLENLSWQTLLPDDVILVDGAPVEDRRTAEVVAPLIDRLPFHCRYIRNPRGTAIQRNAGIEAANGSLVAFIDDDVRLEPDFLEKIAAVFANDKEKKVGGVVGYRTNQHFSSATAKRWRWYRRLGLLTTFEPGRYDFQTGYPINANMQSPFTGVKEVDFMTTACAVWRREVFESGLRFDPFFRDYGVLEDAHFALKAARHWKLLQCGDARCEELHSSGGRTNSYNLGYKCVVNYYFVFHDIVKPLTWQHQARFWRYQAFELFRLAVASLSGRNPSAFTEIRGRLKGLRTVIRESIRPRTRILSDTEQAAPFPQ